MSSIMDYLSINWMLSPPVKCTIPVAMWFSFFAPQFYTNKKDYEKPPPK